jgi:hypothetical protein
VDGIFAVWPHCPDKLNDFFIQISCLKPSIQFAMENESNNMIPFLDALVARKETALTTKVYREPIHPSTLFLSSSSKKGSGHQSKEDKPLGSVFTPYVKFSPEEQTVTFFSSMQHQIFRAEKRRMESACFAAAQSLELPADHLFLSLLLPLHCTSTPPPKASC